MPFVRLLTLPPELSNERVDVDVGVGWHGDDDSQVAGQFSQFSRVWFVILQADADYRARPEDFNKVYVRAADMSEDLRAELRTIDCPRMVEFRGIG